MNDLTGVKMNSYRSRRHSSMAFFTTWSLDTVILLCWPSPALSHWSARTLTWMALAEIQWECKTCSSTTIYSTNTQYYHIKIADRKN